MTALSLAKHILSTIDGHPPSDDIAPLLSYLRHLVSSLPTPHPHISTCATAILAAMDAQSALTTDPQPLLAFIRSLLAGLASYLADEPPLPSPLKTPAAARNVTIDGTAAIREGVASASPRQSIPARSESPQQPITTRSFSTSSGGSFKTRSEPSIYRGGSRTRSPSTHGTHTHGPSGTYDLLRSASGSSASSGRRSGRVQKPALPPTFGGLTPFIDKPEKPESAKPRRPATSSQSQAAQVPRKRPYVACSADEGEEEEGLVVMRKPKDGKTRGGSVESIDSD